MSRTINKLLTKRKLLRPADGSLAGAINETGQSEAELTEAEMKLLLELGTQLCLPRER